MFEESLAVTKMKSDLKYFVRYENKFSVCAGEPGALTVVRFKLLPLSNYFMCSVKVFGHNFVSSENACQWRFLTYLDLPDLANEVSNPSTAAEAKSITSRVPTFLHRDRN